MTERTRMQWAELAHKFHAVSASNDEVVASHHPLCPLCNPDQLEKEEWDELAAAGPGSTGTQRDDTDAPRADGRGEESREAAGGPDAINAGGRGSAVVEPVVATVASWGYEARQAYLARVLKFVPFLADALRSGGIETSRYCEPFAITTPLWTGTYDADGLPIPAENPAWFHEVWPVYDGPEPELNKTRSLRDTLIVSPESGPRLIAAGLWTGAYDAAGLPIPTPAPIDNRRHR